jgi:hypothetical protein
LDPDVTFGHEEGTSCGKTEPKNTSSTCKHTDVTSDKSVKVAVDPEVVTARAGSSTKKDCNIHWTKPEGLKLPTERNGRSDGQLQTARLSFERLPVQTQDSRKITDQYIFQSNSENACTSNE